MNLSNFINKESVTRVAAGTIGALATLPLKKFVTPKIPFINRSEMTQDISLLIGGIAVAAFSSNKNIKTAGFGMSLVSGFNLAKGMVQKAGIGSIQDGNPAFMGNVEAAPAGVLMGTTGSQFDGDSFDTTSGNAGEMDF